MQEAHRREVEAVEAAEEESALQAQRQLAGQDVPPRGLVRGVPEPLRHRFEARGGAFEDVVVDVARADVECLLEVGGAGAAAGHLRLERRESDVGLGHVARQQRLLLLGLAEQLARRGEGLLLQRGRNAKVAQQQEAVVAAGGVDLRGHLPLARRGGLADHHPGVLVERREVDQRQRRHAARGRHG